MLQFLETGKALYVLAAVCLLGIFSKLVTRNLYKRLIKETDNMSLTKNKNLRNLRQKIENTYRLNHGISNASVFIDKQMYSFKFMKMSLDGWNNFSSQAMLLTLILGGSASFLSYWFRFDSYYIVLYGSVGILGSLLMAFVDNGANIGLKKRCLATALQEYVENSSFSRNVREGEPAPIDEIENIRNQNRKRRARGAAFHEAATEESGAAEAQPVERRAVSETGSRKDIDYLKKSLEQIAASREKTKPKKSSEDWSQNLNPEEMKVLGDIIKEYFGNS